MARMTVVKLIDDLTQKEAPDGRTELFSFGGKTYEIDLSPDSYARFEKALKPFVEVARPANRPTQQPKKSTSSAGKAENNAIREWAKANGHDVSDRGRISESMVAAWQNAGKVVKAAKAAPKATKKAVPSAEFAAA